MSLLPTLSLSLRDTLTPTRRTFNLSHLSWNMLKPTLPGKGYHVRSVEAPTPRDSESTLTTDVEGVHDGEACREPEP